MRERTATIDLDLLDRIRAAVTAPLVLHGSSGVPDADLAAAATQGIVKINLATQLNIAFTAAIRQHLAADPDVTDPRRYLPERVRPLRTLWRTDCLAERKECDMSTRSWPPRRIRLGLSIVFGALPRKGGADRI